MLCVVVISIVTFPRFNTDKPTIHEVFYCGWMTAVSTGLGVLPFCVFKEPNKLYMGISNAVAGGMMLAASYSLVLEAMEPQGPEGLMGFSGTEWPYVGSFIGIAAGIVFIILTQRYLDQYEHLKLGEMQGVNAQRMILIIFVMTLHSLTEGIGIGVSFGGNAGQRLGKFISLSLAVHNVPEGLAVALPLTARKVSKLRASLWAIATSLPQPLMAIPSFLFVEYFQMVLPCGLGFAAGAMSYVAVFELIMEAVEDTSWSVTIVSSVVAFIVMLVLQDIVKDSLH